MKEQSPPEAGRPARIVVGHNSELVHDATEKKDWGMDHPLRHHVSSESLARLRVWQKGNCDEA